MMPLCIRLGLDVFASHPHCSVVVLQIIEIARTMRARSMAKDFKGTVKEILGTAVSVGCTVDGESPKDLQQKIDDGELEVPAQ